MKRFAGALLCTLVLVTAASAAVAPPATAADSRAVVVIDTGQGSRRAVISFSGTITGIQALQLAGANPVTYGYAGQGAAVCALDGVGHDATSSCLGTPSDPRYWAYFRAVDGASTWSYSNQCACGSTVRDGDVEGWRFGTGQQPPFVSFCDAAGCAPPPTPPPTAPPSPPAPQPSSGRRRADRRRGSARRGWRDRGVRHRPREPGRRQRGPDRRRRHRDDDPTDDLAAAGRTGNGGGSDRRSAAALPRVRDDGGGGSPWGVLVAVAVVAILGLLAVFVRRRRSAA